MRRLIPLLLLPAVLLSVQPASAQEGPTRLAVFNFQMKSATPDWTWLEKFLSDQLTTDFATQRSLAVVARDQMQVLAAQMNWAPEFAVQAGKTAEIRSRLQIQYVVTGVYTIDGDKIEIIGQVVDLSTNQEVSRKTVAGKADQSLELQKKLAGELLAWFIKKPPAQVQAALPVWTRALPAAKALYEGMDLYDHGRYAEAWLKFRSASHADPDYLEALYWVGKMYYFMDRYEHARRAMERFVYMSGGHPRIGDAIKEYLDTYEQLDAPAETLLAIYETFRQRWPDAVIYDNYFFLTGNQGSAADWLNLRSARILQALGRHEEAAKFSVPAYRHQGIGNGVCTQSVVARNCMTGKTSPNDVLLGPDPHPFDRQLLVQFVAGETEKRISLMISPQTFVAVAPDGCTFKRLRVFPTGKSGGPDDEMTFVVRPADSVALAAGVTAKAPLSKAAAEGLTCDDPPIGGMVLISVGVSSPTARSLPGGPPAIRLVAEFEPVRNGGAIAVTCATASDFRVRIDGRLGRMQDGMIGPLSAGRHAVRFEPMGLPEDSIYGPWETTADVQAGKVTQVTGQLTFKPATPMAGWQGRRVATTYPGHELCMKDSINNRPCLLAGPEGLRMLWVYRRDIWSSTSADGVSFSPPRKLALPISSAWSGGRPAVHP